MRCRKFAEDLNLEIKIILKSTYLGILINEFGFTFHLIKSLQFWFQDSIIGFLCKSLLDLCSPTSFTCMYVPKNKMFSQLTTFLLKCCCYSLQMSSMYVCMYLPILFLYSIESSQPTTSSKMAHKSLVTFKICFKLFLHLSALQQPAVAEVEEDQQWIEKLGQQSNRAYFHYIGQGLKNFKRVCQEY